MGGDSSKNGLSMLGISQDEAEGCKEQHGKSLYIFTFDGAIRRNLRAFIHNTYFPGFIYHMIALNSLLLILDSPDLADLNYQKKTIDLFMTIISIIFIFECLIKIIVLGFYFGHKTYLKDGWNILDFVIVCFSILTIILENAIQSDLSFIRGFRALRALRPLRVVSKSDGKYISRRSYYKLKALKLWSTP